MLKHEFGIMQESPTAGKSYVEYEPQKYDCIAINDEDLEPIASKLADRDFYWNSIDRPAKGLAYCGITLIQPSSIDYFLAAIAGNEALKPLEQLLLQAQKENKFIIHYGI